ncbi:MAG: hypothetical protein ACFFCW_14070 [Candidatus Hodarchaeota archaeon]
MQCIEVDEKTAKRLLGRESWVWQRADERNALARRLLILFYATSDTLEDKRL